MEVVVLADETQKEELGKSILPQANVVWVTDENEFVSHKEADAFLDLGFAAEENRIALLSQLLPKLVVVNSVVNTLQETNKAFVRINGWNTFLSSTVIEAVCHNESTKPKAEEAFSFFQKKLEWLSDDPGFITARVVSMIVNEALLALSEGVSTKEEINTAMKLGTAYPYGPFEWAEKIGVQNIAALLQKLSQTQPRYTPSALLLQEAAERLRKSEGRKR